MIPEAITYAHSTDQLGLAGQSTDKFLDIIPTDSRFTATEVVALRPIFRLRTFVDKLEEAGFTVVQIHGRTGTNGRESWLDRLKLAAYEVISPTSQDLFRHFPDKEILVHRPEAARTEVYEAAALWKPKFLWIENHLGQEELDMSLLLAEAYTASGIAAGVMFDAGHYVYGWREAGDFDRRWDDMVSALHRHADQHANIQGVHLCIGTAHDNIPLEEVTDAQLQKLAYALSRLPLRVVVFENQQHGVPGLLGSALLAPEKMKLRTAGIYRRLTSAGFLPEEWLT